MSDRLAIKKQRTYGKAIIMKRPVSISNDRTGERNFFLLWNLTRSKCSCLEEIFIKRSSLEGKVNKGINRIKGSTVKTAR